MTRLFLDANVVIDLLAERHPLSDDAAFLLAEAYHKRVQLFVSPITFATASYLLGKHHSYTEVRGLLSNLRELVRVAAADERVVDDAIISGFSDFEDALQYYSAKKAKAEFIITRNSKDFALSQIPVMTAAEYLAMGKR